MRDQIRDQMREDRGLEPAMPAKITEHKPADRSHAHEGKHDQFCERDERGCAGQISETEEQGDDAIRDPENGSVARWFAEQILQQPKEKAEEEQVDHQFLIDRAVDRSEDAHPDRDVVFRWPLRRASRDEIVEAEDRHHADGNAADDRGCGAEFYARSLL